MLSKNEAKELKSLHQKKYRRIHQRYLVEGDRSVKEALRFSNAIEKVFYVEGWDGESICREAKVSCEQISERELKQICELKNPNKAVAVIELDQDKAPFPHLADQWHLYLDRIQDPGNLGTVIRIADWYGMSSILVSHDTVDEYNQKVIQASMGGIFRVKVHRMSAEDVIECAKEAGVPLYATTMTGESIHQIEAGHQGILMMGNEGQGLQSSLLENASDQLCIPGGGKAESLNVAVATGILVDWIHRSI